ncbi:DNA mismatch repair protein Msh4 [Apiospora kogelbergensis]|uniref:DNA mismatch repair protein Msh4 n=1 Tax=Apiospora kogelbergensis TaxID=1337665 RepID=UPI00312E6FA9
MSSPAPPRWPSATPQGSVAGYRRLPNSSTRTSTSTPYPLLWAGRQTPASQSTSQSRTRSRSVASSSYQSGHRRNASASGRRSRAASSVWGSDGHQVICAISEARGVSPSVGLAFINATTNEAVLSQICDSQFYVKTVHKIEIYGPSVILMVNTAFPPNPRSNLLSILEERLPGTAIEGLDRKYWSETLGLESIHTLSFREDLDAIKVALQGNYYATCSFSAAIKYMKLACHLTIMSHSLRLRYQPSEDTMMIDISTIQSLELMQNIQNAMSKDCLYGILNETLTPMGSRMLRSNILQPSTQVRTLTRRYDALDELAVKEDMFFEIRKVIVPEGASIYASEQAINHVLMIKVFVLTISPLHEALAEAESELLGQIRTYCRPNLTQPVIELIRETINEDVTFTKLPIDMWHQRTYAVKESFESPLEIKFDQDRKYWLRMRECDLEGQALPDILINRVRKGSYVECQTLTLVQLNTRITDSHNEAVMLSDRVIHSLLDSIREHIPQLFCLMPQGFTPNDVFANEQHRFQIVTGCNMSGKSTYIRMVALLQVMAQIGCFVPAEFASFPIIHQLFVRMSTDDSIEANMSTFSIEMREMAFILRNINKQSLAVIDELGRGTSTRDGLAIAIAISEALLQSDAFVWFATHFEQLTAVLGSRPGVLNLHLETEVSRSNEQETPKMTMLYKVNSGPAQEEHYGINLAQTIGFPEQFIEIAEDVSSTLVRQVEERKRTSQSRQLGLRRKLILNLFESLVQLRSSDMDDAALGSYLNQLQGEFVLRMEGIAQNGQASYEDGAESVVEGENAME